jgi:hypothetical protein
MKTGSLWIIRVALTVQFLGVLAVPALVAASDSPRGMWLAEWVNPGNEPALSESRPSPREGRLESNGRIIGVLKLSEDKLTFIEQIGQVDWELDLARVRKVATVNSGPSTSLRAGRALLVVSTAGDEYIVKIIDPDFTPGSPKRALSAIERAIELRTANGR